MAMAALACGKVAHEAPPCAANTDCDCSVERRREDRSCCPAWSRALAGACQPMTLRSAPGQRDLGPAGARRVSIGIDDDGRAVVGWVTANDQEARAVVAAESAAGTFRLTEPFAAVGGQPTDLSLATGPGRRATVAVTVVETKQPDESYVFVAERTDSGAWLGPTDRADRFSFLPRGTQPHVLRAPTGEVLVTWDQWAGDSYGVQIARKLPDSAWERPKTAIEAVSHRVLYANSPRLAAAQNGDVLVSWYQAVRDAPPPAAGSLMAFVSERTGLTGMFSVSTGQDHLSVFGTDVGGQGAGSPRAAFSPVTGEAVCTWTQLDDEAKLRPYVAQRALGGPWQRPKSLAASLGRSRGHVERLEVAFGARGTLVLAWTQEGPDGKALYALRRGRDGEWLDSPDAPVRISLEGAKAGNLALATGHDGAIAIVWSEQTERGSALRLRRGWEGAGWDPPETLAEPERRADWPAVAFGGTPERMAIAWTEGILGRVFVSVLE